MSPLPKGSKRTNYVRAAATRDVKLFCGWDYLLDLVNQTDRILERIIAGDLKPVTPPAYNEFSSPMHKACFATFFLTGARAREILGDDERNPPSPPLLVTNFRLDLDPSVVFVVDMPLLKRWKKVDWEIVTSPEVPDDVPPAHRKLWHYDKERKVYVKKKFVTEIVPETRTFFFRRDEPLVPYLLEWLEICKKLGRSKLFDGNYYYWYWFFRQFDCMREKYGTRVTWRHIYPHWFRAQRASQLAVDYGLDLHEIADWGSWKSLEVVREYVGTAGSIRKKMLSAKPPWS
ncbi:MAG: hypothetical protein QW764_02880 [Desulfurococcaceae archaeon]